MQILESQLPPMVGRDQRGRSDRPKFAQASDAGDAISSSSGAAWYVVETREGGLEKAKLRLAVSGLTIWAPVDVKRDPNRGRKGKPRRDIRIPRFGRYFFIRATMTDSLCNAIDTTPGVLRLLRAAGTDEPALVSDEHIAWLKENRHHAAPGAAPFATGDKVRFKGGPFAGFDAVVRTVDKRGALQVEVSMFGALTPTVTEAGAVELVDAAKSRALATPGKKPHGAHVTNGAGAL